jgi:branched-subunit amino acid aminotransferase/4-amino-4-deoxychorismate lyase
VTATLGSLRPFGLAETCRVVGGGIPLWHYHRARLERGGCPPELLTRVEALALTEATRWADSSSRRIRLGITLDPQSEVSIVSGVHLSSLDVVNDPVAVRIDLSEVATPEHPTPPLPAGAAKPADRSWWDVAQRLAKRRGGHQAVIVDGEDNLIDGGSATVWVVEDGRLITPPSPPAVGGVARAFVLDALARRGLEVSVEPISWERFESAAEAFFTNAFAGAVAARGRGGTGYSAVRELFEMMWRPGAR